MGLAIIAREGADARKKAVPFGVFLALGGLVGVLAGPELIDLYERSPPELTPQRALDTRHLGVKPPAA